MSLKAKVEAIIYATEEPVTLDELVSLLGDSVLSEVQVEPLPSGADQPASDDGAAAGQNTIAAKEQKHQIKVRLRTIVDQIAEEYATADHGIEIREVAGGYRMSTKPEHHDVVVSFAKSLKPPVRLSLPALETLSVIAYRQPVTVPEISEIRGVDTSGVIATLLDRKLITTAGRKQVIGRPILYKTTKEFLLRFGLKDLAELPSVEEFEKLGEPQAELFSPAADPVSKAALTEADPAKQEGP